MRITIKYLIAIFFAFGCGSLYAEELTGKALKIHNSIIQATPIYQDKELHEYANRLAQKIGKVSDQPERTFRVFILDSEGVNAFTPGYGLIYFYRGLITQLTTEGEFAAVIAHEIGHNIGRHIGRSGAKRTLGNIGETLASILAGNSGVGSAIGVSNSVREQAFARELELEADAYAAKYLYASGYAPDEMIAALSILKDQSLLQGKIQGSSAAHYHGVFDSHPSTDKRLRKLVDAAGTLPPGEEFRGREEMREMLKGVVVGTNHTGNIAEGEERYVNKKLGITFVYPDDWSRVIKGQKIVLKDPEETIQLKITIEKTQDKSLDSTQVLKAKYPDDLSEVEKIDANATRDLGSIGRRPQQRVGAVQVARNTYHLQGIARNNQLSDEQDAQLSSIIKSFRRASRQDLSADENLEIYYRRLQPGETFASLAQDRVMGKYTEGYLRVMNGYYPKGEAEPGTYMKLVRKAAKKEQK